jgi:DNA-binding CsgD family transcriptional regulator
MMEMSIGLARPAETVYRTMLERRRWHLADLAQSLGWSEDEVRRVLDALHGAGLVTESADEEDALRAIEPCVALTSLAARNGRGSGGRVATSEAIDRFVAAHERTTGQCREQVESNGLDEISGCVERLISRSTREAILMVPTYAAGSFEFCKAIVEVLLHHGVTIRMIWSAHLLTNPVVEAYASWLIARGVVPRIVGYVPSRAVIVDGGAFAVEPLHQAAEELWNRGAEVSRPDAGRAEAPQSRNEIVLRLLAKGLTDDAVARRIGVSVRTVRNDVASAMSVLDARSRFQAGVLAAQRGLI